MRAHTLLSVLILVGLGPSVGLAQDPPVRPEKPDAPPQAVPADTLGGFPVDSLGFPLDSMARDTTPIINLQERRDALSEGGFPDRDSLFNALTALPGYEVLEYRGQEVRLGVETQTIHLSGDAQVNRGSDVLKADTIRYDGLAMFMAAIGGIQLVGEGNMQVLSDSVLYYDISRSKGTILDAESSFAQRGTTWRVFGDVIPKAQDTLFATSAAFTSCDLEVPHYRFAAGEMKMVTDDMVVAWPVVLYIANIPVFWLPFFAQDIRQGRRSGILPPRFGINDIVRTSSSFNRNISDMGYYWAINDFLDAQATLDWFSNSYTRVNGAFRYRVLKKFIRGNVAASYSWGPSGTNLAVALDHDQELGLRTKLKANIRYVRNTQLFQDQTFDPRLQTGTIDSNLGLTHRFSFAALSASSRRRQFLSTGRKVELTLPQVNISFSPVTLFPAPRTREGAFNNMTLSGSANYSRLETTSEITDNTTRTNAGTSASLRVRSFNLSGGARLAETATSPLDSLGLGLNDFSVSTISWNTAADYQIDLIGSTTLRPTAGISGSLFRSFDTSNDYLSTPTRLNFGATLTTAVFGFWPGFGPFSRVRHKFAPQASWAYSPEVQLDSALAAIPGFPAAGGSARNTLNVAFRQTFEAKVKPPEAPGSGRESGRQIAAKQAAADTASAWISLLAGAPAVSIDRLRTSPNFGQATGDTLVGPAAIRRQEQTATLLAINTSGLSWDFERSKLGLPTLITEQLTNGLTSDLLRGFTINMTHDLFSGVGTERKFSPSLARLAMSFSIQSGTGIGDMVGLRRAGARPDPLEEQRQQLDSRGRLMSFDPGRTDDPFAGGGQAGPWSLNLRYSLVRTRAEEVGGESQTIDGTLSFHPTSKWAIRWSTQYSFTNKEFGAQLITLDRDLHRWRASFQFSRAPNGNVIFQVLLALTDAPDLKVTYDQKSEPPS